MGMDIHTRFMVGVTYYRDGDSVKALEERGDVAFGGDTLTFGRHDTHEALETVASVFGLEVGSQMPRPEVISYYVIGESWKERPSDDEVEAAKKRIGALVPSLEAVLGEVCAGVGEDRMTSISV